MWRIATKTWLVWACLTMSGLAQQIEIVVPDEKLEVGQRYLIDVPGLTRDMVWDDVLKKPKVTLVAEPRLTTKAIGVSGWAGEQYIWFRATDPGRRVLVLAFNGQMQPFCVSAVLEVGGTSPDPPPPPPPPPGELTIVVVEESNDRTSNHALVYLGLQSYLTSKKISWRIADKDQKDGLTGKTPPWLSNCLEAIQKKSVNLPAIVAGAVAADRAGGFLVAGVDPLPGTIAEASEWVQQYEQPAKPKKVSIFVPMPQKIVESMLLCAQVDKDDVIYDLGCGDGRIVVTAARKYGCRAVGVEIDPGLAHQASQEAQRAGVDRLVEIRQGDLFDVDLSPATVVCVYLAAEDCAKLAPQLKRLRKGSRIVSYAHPIPGIPVDIAYRTGEGKLYTTYVPSIRVRLPGPRHSVGGCNCGMCVGNHLMGSHGVKSKMLGKIQKWTVYHDNLHNYATGG